MIKIKLLICFVLVFFGSLTTCVFAQNSNFNIDTLNFEYEGSLQEHNRLVVRNLSNISICLEGSFRGFEKRHRTFYEYPLVKSYLKRISLLVEEKLKLPSYSTKVYSKDANGKSYIEYSFNKGFNTFISGGSFNSKPGEYIAKEYMEAVIYFVCNFSYYNNSISNVVNDLKDEQFSKLISEASVNGIKKVATVNGFYNKKLALKLSRAILFNNIQKLLKSNQELAYRIVYVADYYIAFKKLNEDSYPFSSQNEEIQDEVLNIMLKK